MISFNHHVLYNRIYEIQIIGLVHVKLPVQWSAMKYRVLKNHLMQLLFEYFFYKSHHTFDPGMSTRRKVSILCLIEITGTTNGENDMEVVTHGPPNPTFELVNF